MIRVPDWAFEAAGQESRGMNQDAAAYHPGLYLTPAQREAVKALIQELPRFSLKAVPTDCSECLICLEEFREGNECRCSVFPNLDLSALSNIRSEYQQSSESSVGTSTRYVQLQPSSQSYLLRLQGLVHPVHSEITGPNGETDNAIENAENGVVPGTTRNVSNL